MMADVVELEAWRGQLQTSKQGYRKSMTNLMLFLKNRRELGRTIRWNELAQRADWNGEPLTDHHLIDIRLILEASQFEPSVGDLLPAVMRHARENAYHPVRDYLSGLKWDGTKRLDHWLQLCLGAADTPFNRTVGRKTLIAAVARAFSPGCKVDTVLILEGEQGVAKSTAIATLFGPDWTAESVNLFDQHNKMVMSMMGAWVVELAEFIAIQKRDENMVKGMLSIRSDRVVLPYAKMASDHPRQCIFFGTINPSETGYLTDSTGNRRYWPVRVDKADLALITSRRDQIWAEAMDAYQHNEAWWLESDEEKAVASEVVAERDVYDSWQEVLEEKLKGASRVRTSDALHLIGVLNDRIDRKAELRIANCLRALGYTLRVVKDNHRRSVRMWVKGP